MLGNRMKKCRRCLKEKSLSEFWKDKSNKDGHKNICIGCNRLLNKYWYERNRKEKINYSKNKYCKYRYGISFDDKRKLWLGQDKKCLICREEMLLGKSCHIDHDHNTKEIRGLLCSKCNQLIGLARKSKEILLSAIKYLEKKQYARNW